MLLPADVVRSFSLVYNIPVMSDPFCCSWIFRLFPPWGQCCCGLVHVFATYMQGNSLLTYLRVKLLDHRMRVSGFAR